MSPYTRANLAIAHGRKGLAAHGIRLPVRSGEGALLCLVDADGKAFGLVLPIGSPGAQRSLADAVAAAINAGCGCLPAAQTIAAE